LGRVAVTRFPRVTAVNLGLIDSVPIVVLVDPIRQLRHTMRQTRRSPAAVRTGVPHGDLG